MKYQHVQFLGAVGTFANINPKVESYVAKKLKLKV